MRRNNAESIGTLIRKYLREEGLETPLNEQRLLESWKEAVGPLINSYTKELFIRNQILYVALTSAALREELMMGRKQLVRKLNERVGATVITNIILR
jgi:predicted nucleic acid-binding Zn ribbon protein